MLFIHHALCTSKVTCQYGEYSLLEPIVVQHANVLLRDTECFTRFVMRDGSKYALLQWRDWYVSQHRKVQCQGKHMDFYTAFNDSLTMIESWVKEYCTTVNPWWDKLDAKEREEYKERVDPFRKRFWHYPF